MYKPLKRRMTDTEHTLLVNKKRRSKEAKDKLAAEQTLHKDAEAFQAAAFDSIIHANSGFEAKAAAQAALIVVLRLHCDC